MPVPRILHISCVRYYIRTLTTTKIRARQPQERASATYNDLAAPKTAEESGPSTGNRADFLTEDAASQSFEKQQGAGDYTPNYSTYSQWRGHEKGQAEDFKKSHDRLVKEQEKRKGV